MSNQTPTTLRLTHVFAADGSDVAKPGSYRILAKFTTPTGIRRADAVTCCRPGWMWTGRD